MERLSGLVEAVQSHPALAATAVLVLIGGYYLLQRKPRIARDAERQLAALRKERAAQYSKLRRPR